MKIVEKNFQQQKSELEMANKTIEDRQSGISKLNREMRVLK